MIYVIFHFYREKNNQTKTDVVEAFSDEPKPKMIKMKRKKNIFDLKI